MIHIIHKNPWIIYAASGRINDIGIVKQYLKNEKVYIIIHNQWYIDEYSIKQYSHDKILFDNNLNHKIVFAANCETENETIKNAGLDSFFCNSNAFIDPNLFFPKSLNKKYKSVYNARFSSLKRHYLARKIEGVACLAWGFYEDVEKTNLKQVLTNNTNFILLNEIENDNIVGKNTTEINNIYNESYVGLCLSPIEGAMFSSVEYLLSGIPVVSTRSLGGRDVFFDDSNSVIVDDTPEAVYDAVETLITNYNRIDPIKIRENTILKQIPHVQRFKEKVKNILLENNIETDIEQLYQNVYTHKMLTWYSSIDQFINTIR